MVPWRPLRSLVRHRTLLCASSVLRRQSRRKCGRLRAASTIRSAAHRRSDPHQRTKHGPPALDPAPSRVHFSARCPRSLPRISPWRVRADVPVPAFQSPQSSHTTHGQLWPTQRTPPGSPSFSFSVPLSFPSPPFPCILRALSAQSSSTDSSTPRLLPGSCAALSYSILGFTFFSPLSATLFSVCSTAALFSVCSMRNRAAP